MAPAYRQDGVDIYHGDVIDVLNRLAAQSVQCVVTSPPYFGLRAYHTDVQVWGGATGERADRDTSAFDENAVVATGDLCQHCGAWRGELGSEPSVALYLEHIVAVFRAVWRVLRDDGTLWLNLGDSYANDGKWGGHTGGKHVKALHDSPIGRNKKYTGFKPKELMGIPWRVAFALQDDGWWLRQDIVWAKSNPMPESVQDRCTKSHEYLFLMSKSPRYYFDAAGIAEPAAPRGDCRPFGSAGGNRHGDEGSVYTPKWKTPDGWDTSRGNGGHGTFHKDGRESGHGGYVSRSGNKERKPASDRGVPVDTNGQTNGAVAGSVPWEGMTRNRRDVWTIATEPCPLAHFATFPTALVEPCILAGSRIGDTVLDPFMGSGTTGLVAKRLQRRCVGVELRESYIGIAAQRLGQPAMFGPDDFIAPVDVTDANQLSLME